MKLNVHTAQQQYDIVLAPHIIQDLGELVRAVSGATDVAVITDTNVGPAYATAVCEQLCKCGFDVFPLTVPAGETSKCIEQAAALWGALRMRGIGRDGLVVALGGGVVGDLAGFVASTYMRGIPFIQVPTSLLAMVDSSIGGKTAIDLDDAKNIVGTFYQPSLVLADTDTLKTLPQSEWLNGFAEIAKCAVIDGGEAYEWLSNNADKLYAHDAAAVSRAIEYALRLKARVVEHDEKEAGERECLNYGHTLAHALETASGFTMPHGRAVADGMRFASRLSGMAAGQTSDMAGGAVRAVQAGRVTCASQAGQAADFINEQDALLDKLGLAFASRDANYGVDGLYEHMLGDKKARGGVPRFVLVDKPGTWHVAPMERDVVTQALRGFYQQS